MRWTERSLAVALLLLLGIGLIALTTQSPTTLPAGCVYQEVG